MVTEINLATVKEDDLSLKLEPDDNPYGDNKEHDEMVLQTLHCNDCDVVLYHQENMPYHLKGHQHLEQQTIGDNEHEIGPEPIAEIRLAYDALKDINLKDDTRESTTAKPDEYLDLIKT